MEIPYTVDLAELTRLRNLAIAPENWINPEYRAAYYRYIADNGDNYGNLARGVILGDTLAGVVANRFFVESSYRNFGLIVNSEIQQQIQVRLLDLDYAARVAAGGPLPYIKHLENHDIAFSEVGSGIEAWTAYLPVRLFGNDAWERMILNPEYYFNDGIWVGVGLASATFVPGIYTNPVVRAEMGTWTAAVSLGVAEFWYGGSTSTTPDDRWYDPMTGVPYTRCFLAGTPILMAGGTEKPIEQVRPGDWVLSFDPANEDGRGALVPRLVTRTFSNVSQNIVNLRGLHLTPGHICLSGEGCFETVAELLRRDSTLVNRDGHRLRARTGAEVGAAEDTPVIVTYIDSGSGRERYARVRAGIPCGVRRGGGGALQPVSLLEMIARQGFALLPNGQLRAPDGTLADATDWPPDSTPFDHPAQRNWVVATDEGTSYIPDWIVQISIDAEAEEAMH